MNSAIAQQRITKSGWLRKQGGLVKTWHTRWFVLNGDALFYFGKEDDIKPLGTIFLPGNRVVEIPWKPEDPEKFLFEVVPGKSQSKMAPNHDTFLLWAGGIADRQEWISVIRKVMFSSVGGAMFGQKLEDTMTFERDQGNTLPHIVEQCIEFITEHALRTEGIFRLAGRTALLRDLKESFDSGDRPEFLISLHDVHTVGSLLKTYLRELPESIIPSNCYQQFMNIALRYQSSKNPCEVDELKSAVASLPDDNYILIEYLCKFLNMVGKYAEENKMHEKNLALIFGPNFIRHMDDSPELFMATADLNQLLAYMLIHYYDTIFTGDRRTAYDPVAVDDLLKLSVNSDELEEAMVPTSAMNGAISDIIDIKFENEVFVHLDESIDSAPSATESSFKIKLGETMSDACLLNLQGRSAFRSRESRSPDSVLSRSASVPMRPRGLEKPIPPKRRSRMKGSTLPRSSISPTVDEGDTEKPSTLDSNVNLPSPTSKGDIEMMYPLRRSHHSSSLSSSERTSAGFSSVISSDGSSIRSSYDASYDSWKSALSSDDNPTSPRGGSVFISPREDNSDVSTDHPTSVRLSATDNSQPEEDDHKLLPSKEQMRVTIEILKDELTRSKTKCDTQVKALKAELIKLREKYDKHIQILEDGYTRQVDEMLAKLDAERTSRVEAVNKTVTLQAQLHQYQMQFGEIRPPSFTF